MRWTIATAATAAAFIVCAPGCKSRAASTLAPQDINTPWPILSTDFLTLAPADTPFLLVQEEPLPAAAIERMAPMLEPLAAAIDLGLREAFLKLESEQQAVVEGAFDGRPSLATFGRLGFTLNTPFVLYGLGPIPVLRWRLRDPARFRRFIEEDYPTSDADRVAHFHGQAYLRGETDSGVTAVVAIVGPDIVATLLPNGAIHNELLALVFGQALPTASLSSSGAVRSLRDGHHLSRSAVGFIDFAELFDMFLVVGRGLNRRVAQALAGELGDVGATCVAEAQRVTNLMPRLVTGFESLDSDSVRWSVTLETNRTAAAWLAKLPGSIPQPYASDADTIATVAAGVDVGVLAEAIGALGNAIADDPFKCEELADLNGLGVLTLAGLRDVRGPVAAIKGAAIGITDLMPGTTDPAEILFVVDIAEPKRALEEFFDDTPGFRPQRLGVGKVVPLARAFTDWANEKDLGGWIGLGEHGVGVSVGPAAKPIAKAAIERRRPDDGALVVASMNFDKWMAHRPDRIEKLLRERSRLVAQLAAGMLTLMSHIEFSLHATARGLSLRADLRPQRQRPSP